MQSHALSWYFVIFFTGLVCLQASTHPTGTRIEVSDKAGTGSLFRRSSGGSGSSNGRGSLSRSNSGGSSGSMNSRGSARSYGGGSSSSDSGQWWNPAQGSPRSPDPWLHPSIRKYPPHAPGSNLPNFFANKQEQAKYQAGESTRHNEDPHISHIRQPPPKAIRRQNSGPITPKETRKTLKQSKTETRHAPPDALSMQLSKRPPTAQSPKQTPLLPSLQRQSSVPEQRKTIKKANHQVDYKPSNDEHRQVSGHTLRYVKGYQQRNLASTNNEASLRDQLNNEISRLDDAHADASAHGNEQAVGAAETQQNALLDKWMKHDKQANKFATNSINAKVVERKMEIAGVKINT